MQTGGFVLLAGPLVYVLLPWAVTETPLALFVHTDTGASTAHDQGRVVEPLFHLGATGDQGGIAVRAHPGLKGLDRVQIHPPRADDRNQCGLRDFSRHRDQDEGFRPSGIRFIMPGSSSYSQTLKPSGRCGQRRRDAGRIDRNREPDSGLRSRATRVRSALRTTQPITRGGTALHRRL